MKMIRTTARSISRVVVEAGGPSEGCQLLSRMSFDHEKRLFIAK